MKMKTHTVVKTLGGPAQVGQLIGRTSANVSMWHRKRKIPARFYLLIRDELAKRGHKVSTDVFSFARASRKRRR